MAISSLFRRRIFFLRAAWRWIFWSVATAVFLWANAAAARADVRLPGLFSDHMVLQRSRPVRVWGWASEGEEVTVEFRGQKAQAQSEQGKWSVVMGPFGPGGPDQLVVRGKNTLELRDVLVGDLWVCSGQSNMEFPLDHSYNAKEDIDGSANPNLRLFTVKKKKSDEPLDDAPASWEECGPKSTPHFSAVAYYFGRDLQKALGIPIGLIHSSWGGSPAEVWVGREILEANPEYRRDILDAYEQAMRQHRTALAEFDKRAAEAKQAGRAFTQRPPGAPYWKPSELYNGMIAPLVRLVIRGAIWYQGESNANRARQYRTLFPDMIGNWRRDWQEGDFPFFAVQLAPWDKGKKRTLEQITAAPVESDWAELREAQVHATKVLPAVGLAVITDVGDKDDIHPTRKERVGARLAITARAIAYGEPIEYSGPEFDWLEIRGCEATVHFRHVGGGLIARDGELKGFALAGPDGKFMWAKASIRGDTVVVEHAEIAHPAAVRYGWADFPVVNLWNKNGMPASPFRTDEYPPLTGRLTGNAKK